MTSPDHHNALEVRERRVDAAALAELSNAGVDPRFARLYAARGVSTAADLNLKLDALLSPSLLAHIDHAARHLADAIGARKRILIVADYDADGATACAVGVRALRQMGASADFLVPNRFTLGYGLTPEVIDLAITHRSGKPDVIVTVDNGIASIEGVAAANRVGIEVVVTDHHLPGATLPDAAVIVNPNQPGDNFPSKSLAGVGVMFYVMLALRAELRSRNAFAGRHEPNLADLLDLVALGTVADVVKLEHNNRVLVEQGLMRIRSGRCCKGILALLSVAGRDYQRAGSYDLGFVLGPRINAAGRLDDMSVGIACLLADDMPTAMHLATDLDRLNRERRAIESDMREAATQSLESVSTHDRYALCLYQPDWHQGVVGILAGRIREQTHRPVIAFARDESGKLRGSGRSIPALHLRDALDLVTKRHPELILRFGGHAMAAGLTIEEASFEAFSMALEQVTRELLSPVDLLEIREVDGGLSPDELDFNFVRDIDAQVWGQGFVAPSYLGRFQLMEQRIVGEKHLKLRVRHGAESFEAIRFGSADSLPTQIEAIYRPTINIFRGSAVIQFNIDHVL